jgi:cytochrome b involved in lipid metabolism
VLATERTNARLGHENEGFLSLSHGFVPCLEPRLALDPRFAAWDDVAARMPELHRTLTLRREVDALPLLDASARSLDDADVLRACALLAMLAQAYWYVGLRPPERLPAAIERPWAELRSRLGRTQEVLSYIDLIVYNWRLRQRDVREPMRVENLDLLLPTVGTREERVFYLTQLEILARAAPVVRLVTEAQEAVGRDDPAALEQVLSQLSLVLGDVVRLSLPKINPHPLGDTHVDPVVWAKTVAPFAVPIRAGDQGPSGTSSPLFNTLDLFFGRKSFRSFLGREIEQLRAGYPPAWRAFLGAVASLSIGDYVERKASKPLSSCWREALELYAGEQGFLGRHRMKVYGYLELAFKVGRSVTIGGFGGVFEDRTWDQVDNELSASQAERSSALPPATELAHVQHSRASEHGERSGLTHLTLDIAAAAVRYSAGDRCAILPENDPELIERTLVALGARGDEVVLATDEWREWSSARPELRGRQELLVRDVLRFGCIRPLRPRVAEALHARSQSPLLLDALQRGCTERWELWEVLERLRAEGFDVADLWRAPSGAAGDRLCRLLPPEQPRLYSIASASSVPPGRPAERLELAVGHLRYGVDEPAPAQAAPAGSETAADAPPESAAAAQGGCPVLRPESYAGAVRRGTASSFLARAGREQLEVPFGIDRPARFRLPSDPRTPLVFFAGGTGIAPFLAFLRERSQTPDAGRCWLLWSVRGGDEVGAVLDELSRACRAGSLDLDICFTREALELRDDAEGGKTLAPGASRHIAELMLSPGVAARLVELLGPEAERGLGGAAYVCGSGGFARSVLGTLEQLLAERWSDPGGRIEALAGNQRLSLEVHTDARPSPEPERWLDLSEVAEHNDAAAGYWTIIERNVYDLTLFSRLHPGGERVIQAYAGMDATHGYARAHALRPEVDAMRDMYRIGRLRALQLDERTLEMRGPGGVQQVSCRTVFRAWVQALQLIVEMQNALGADFSLQERVTTDGEPAGERTPYKLSRAAETHYRFLEHYRRVLENETLPRLWRVTQAVFAAEADPAWLEAALRALNAAPEAVDGDALGRDLYERFAEHARDPALLGQRLELLRSADLRLLAALKAALLGGVRAFERHELRMLPCGASALLQACRDLFGAFESCATSLGRELAAPRTEPPPAVVVPQSAGAAPLYRSKHWSFESDASRNVAILRRTPVPWPSLATLAEEADALLAALPASQPELGLLVDMRQAPGRNDPAFEQAMAGLRHGLCSFFARTAVLLESGVGELAAARLERDERRHALCTQSESSALKFLMGGK